MSLRRLKARIERLDRAVAAAEANPAKRFIIDPALARALRDDYERIRDLAYQLDCRSVYHDIDRAETEKERLRLRASIEERARAIVCPASYGPEQRKTDLDRLEKTSHRRHWGTWLVGPPMTAAEDAEEAQARARMLAFYETPEQRARGRIRELDQIDLYRGGRTAAEQQEFDDLRRRYPEPEVDITK
jgi:hypothetical protein